MPSVAEEPEVAAGESAVVSSSRSLLFGEKICSFKAFMSAFSLLSSCWMRVSDWLVNHALRSHVFGCVWFMMDHGS